MTIKGIKGKGCKYVQYNQMVSYNRIEQNRI